MHSEDAGILFDVAAARSGFITAAIEVLLLLAVFLFTLIVCLEFVAVFPGVIALLAIAAHWLVTLVRTALLFGAAVRFLVSAITPAVLFAVTGRLFGVERCVVISSVSFESVVLDFEVSD